MKCVCNTSYSYLIHHCIICQIVINADLSTVGSLLGLNTHFEFLLCVVYMLYGICNFVCLYYFECYSVCCDLFYVTYFVLL